MGSSHSQLGPGMVLAVLGAFWATGGFEALYRRVTWEGELVRKHARAQEEEPEIGFRG